MMVGFGKKFYAIGRGEFLKNGQDLGGIKRKLLHGGARNADGETEGPFEAAGEFQECAGGGQIAPVGDGLHVARIELGIEIIGIGIKNTIAAEPKWLMNL